MSDIIITPASGKIDFYQDLGAASLAKIELTATNDLALSTTSGNLIIGDASRDIYIGNGINDVDIIFEQNGEIRPLPAKTLNIGTSGSFTQILASKVNINQNSFTNIPLDVYSSTSGATILNVAGTKGTLFSVTDNLSGSLMSVNNDAGLPVFEVFSDDRVVAGRFGQNDFVMTSGGNVGIGTSSPVSKLQVSGLVTANSGNFTNSLTVNNNTVWHSGNFDSSNIVRTTGDKTIYGNTIFDQINGASLTLTVSGLNRDQAGIYINDYTGVDPEYTFAVNGSGEIYAGQWSASTIGVNKGGTGRSSYSNGQLLIGSGTSLAANTLTAGTGIGITNGSGTITIGVTGIPSSSITNFNSSVSGLLPSIANSGDNRVLTSTGGSVGVNAESNLTFNGSLLSVTGSGSFSNNVTASGFVRSGGTSSQFLKADGSIDSTAYTTNVGTVTSVAALTLGTTGTDVTSTVATNTTTPVITLNIPTASSSVRGVLSSGDWTTFNNKQATLTNPVTGTGASNHIAYWNSSSSIAHDANQLVWDATNNRLGIGATSPSVSLEVGGSIRQSWIGTDLQLATIYDNSYRMGINYFANQRIMNLFSTSNDGGGAITFSTRGLGAGSSATDYGTERMRIDGSGNIGIGTTSPTSRLQVSGLITANSGTFGNVMISGNMVSATNSNSNLIIKPNGDGALQADDAGNSRGIFSVDLQRSRTSVSGVAHGNYSVIGGGRNNRSAGTDSTIGGGNSNSAGGEYSTVGGGVSNSAGGYKSTVGGGGGNSATGENSTISGGTNNTASGYQATIGGGNSHTNSGYAATIGGGKVNTASNYDATVGGGRYNYATGNKSTVGGGYSNEASEIASTIGGGYNNSASGYYSTVGGGRDNSAGGPHSTVGGGLSNSASNYRSTVGGGQGNSAGGYKSTVGGGYNNSAGGQYSTVGGGINNSAGGNYSTVPGGIQAKATRYGETSHSAGKFSNDGDAQHTILIARNVTSNATAAVLFLDGSVSSLRLTIPAETTWIFTIKLSAYNDTDNLSAGYNIRGCIRRNAASGTSIIGSNIVESWSEGAMSGCVATATADDTNEALQINVTGLASKNIRWVAVVDISQVSYAAP